MPFHMLIHELTAQPAKNPKEKMISGCEVFFPDTLFFERGDPKFIAYNDKDFCLAKWNESEDKKAMPGAADLIPKLDKVIRARKAKKGQHWLQKEKIARQEAVNRSKAAQNPDRPLDQNGADDDDDTPGSPAKPKKKRGQSKLAATGAKGEAGAKKQDPTGQTGSGGQQSKHTPDAWHAFVRYLHFASYKDGMPEGARPSPRALNSGKFESLQPIAGKNFNELSKMRNSTDKNK